MTKQPEHQTVLLHEAVNALAIRPDGIYVDGTFGRGGHSQQILQQLSAQGRLLAVDRDEQAEKTAQQLLGDPRFAFIRSNFAAIEGELKQRGWLGKIDGILLDLGVSSPQLDQAERGFSFIKDGPLDMRMDRSQGRSAADWIASAKVEEMKQVFKNYGEEKFALRIARAIAEARQQQAITRTLQLAEIIENAMPVKDKHKHPATRTFQAIRIFINDELGELRRTLDAIPRWLRSGGRMAVISFHSLEDRMVKRFIKEKARGQAFPKDLPVTDSMIQREFKAIGKAVKPAAEEIANNPRARSAVLRVAEKL